MEKKEVKYYFYYWGDEDFIKIMKYILNNKDFEAFKDLYDIEAMDDMGSRLPDYAVVYENANDYSGTHINILEKDNFMKITEYEYEWG